MNLLSPLFLWLLIPLILLFWYRKKSVTETIHLLILMLIVVALSRPVWMQGIEERPIKGQNYIIALDVSYSMRAKDIKPDRYTFAKETISALLKQNPSDNIMLIAFTTNPLLLSPPTTDHQLIQLALKSLNPDYILTKGTSLHNLFKKVASMQHGEKNLILLSDGGEERQLDSLIKIIEQGAIHLHVVTLGTTKGTTIQTPDGSLLKDDQKQLIISRINPLLKTVALRTGGTYTMPASSPEATAHLLYRTLQKQHHQKEAFSKKQHRYIELYTLPLLLATLLFILLHTRAVSVLLFITVFLGISAEASVFDLYYLHKAYQSYHHHHFERSEKYLNKIENPSLQSRFAQGALYYQKGDYPKARQLFFSIQSSHVPIKQTLYYNIANCYAKEKQYQKAQTYYIKCLQLGEDRDAKINLALIAMLRDKASTPIGISHPKSQNSQTTQKNKNEESTQKRTKEEASSSGNGNGDKQNRAQKKHTKQKLLLTPETQKHPLSSKVYELINKGYIHEQTPW